MAAGRPRDSRGMMVIDNVVRGLRADVHLESVCWRAIDSDHRVVRVDRLAVLFPTEAGGVANHCARAVVQRNVVSRQKFSNLPWDTRSHRARVTVELAYRYICD